MLTTHPRGHGNFRIGGANRGADPATLLPSVVVVAEHYGRIVRMLQNPTMFDGDGEIRGTDKADEVVMLGGHFDSWHASTGGTARPVQQTPAHAKFSGYFNIDNGGGAIRGIYLQGNNAVAPVFRAWIEPLRDLGVTHVTTRNTGGTDHQSFDGAGLPGFQFIQDPMEYSSFSHHSNLDSYERLQPDDMRKNATIAAIFAFLMANRDDLLPRKPRPAAGVQ